MKREKTGENTQKNHQRNAKQNDQNRQINAKKTLSKHQRAAKSITEIKLSRYTAKEPPSLKTEESRETLPMMGEESGGASARLRLCPPSLLPESWGSCPTSALFSHAIYEWKLSRPGSDTLLQLLGCNNGWDQCDCHFR